MSAWVLLSVGVVLAATATTAGVGAAAVRRVDLYRWVARRRSVGVAAGTLLSRPGRVFRAANGLAATGVLLAALGLAAIVARLPLPLAAGTVLLVAVPLLLVMAYALPRAIGRRWPETLVQGLVPWLRRLGVVFAPLAPRSAEAGERAVINAHTQAGDAETVLGSDELTVLSGVLAFTERPVREVMTPRTNIAAVREGASLEEVGRLFADSGYSRIPICRESLDNIIGMIYAFDLLKITPGSELPVRPVASAPASKHCADLLYEMQRERQQFAVVLDEYGGTAGIVTFEDLLEELVGEIFDEYDGRSYAERPMAELVEATGATPAEEIAARFEIALPADAETVGGMLARAAGRIPQTGERYTLAGLEFDVLAATPNRLERVLIRRGPVTPVALERGDHA